MNIKSLKNKIYKFVMKFHKNPEIATFMANNISKDIIAESLQADDLTISRKMCEYVKYYMAAKKNGITPGIVILGVTPLGS